MVLQAPGDSLDPDVERLLRAIYEAGGWVLLDSAVASLPADLRSLLELGAVSVAQLAALYGSTGATAAADLTAAVRRRSIRHVTGLGEAVEAAVAARLPGLRARGARVPLGQAMALAWPLLEALRASPSVTWAEPAGSLRRGRDTVGDIEIVAATNDPLQAINALQAIPLRGRCILRAPRRLYLAVDRVQIGVRLPSVADAAATLVHLTGHWRHVDRLERLAEAQGRSLEPAALRTSNGPLGTDSEAEIYARLGLPWIPPEIREGDEEIERALSGALPPLVARTDIRGDLHMHSHWSDGRDPIEAMAATAAALGYEYIAITDHSPHSAASRNLTVDGVAKQADEIGAVRQRYPGLAILHGCEVDILPDGRLDFPDQVLERFDVVLASLHDGAGASPDQLMRRYLSAMRHPLVSIITHPTNRMVPLRTGYDLDYERLFAAAVESGTALEIDGAPAHLDLDAALARRAVAAGAVVAVNSDSHAADLLDRQMVLGLLTARRGWVEPRHVINTRPLGALRAFLASKRH